MTTTRTTACVALGLLSLFVLNCRSDRDERAEHVQTGKAGTQVTFSRSSGMSGPRDSTVHPVEYQTQNGLDTSSRSSPKSTEDSTSTRWFEEISARLSHQHSDTKYEDFERQPLLSRRLSQNGPGAAWTDLDGDGDDDLLIGTGRGGRLNVFYNNGDGHFTRANGGTLDRSYDRDLTGIVTVPTQEGVTVLVGKSNYERQPDDPAAPSEILVFDAGEKEFRLRNRLDVGPGSVGPLALGDVDGDGDLDLFAGARQVPGQYPASASSVLFINDDGTFQRDASRSRPFEDVGLVTAATFADVNGNGDPDLLVATEWGPIHYFRNQGNGRLVNRTKEVGLDAYTGLWNGLSVGDFNEDGRLDLVATNWGWNSRYGAPSGAPKTVESPLLEHPLRVYYGDFDRSGSMDVIEARYHGSREEYVPYPGLSTMGDALPYLRRRISSFEKYAQSSLPGILGERRFQMASTKEAATVSHMVFLNQRSEEASVDEGVEFTGHALPWWAQLTVGFAPSVADLTGDGHQDLLLSQNFFGTKVDIPRQDGGRALMLRGDGTGRFRPVKGHRSGVLAYGEQRAAPLADIDDDGRTDVLVAQNGAQTKLFRNVGATPGLTVDLTGREENPGAVGATIRLHYESGDKGPATPITIGTSYWSQHSLTPVLGHGGRSVVAVDVTWPDGARSVSPVPSDSQSVTVPHPSN